MAELSEEIRQAYEEAGAAELLARQHPEHLEHSLRAAELFEHAAVLSQRQAVDDEYVEEVRHVALVLADYYFAQMHKSLGWHAYQRRECEVALAELEQEKQHFERAVRGAEGLMPALSEKGKAFLGPLLESWKVSLAAIPSADYTYRARQAWDQGNSVEAIDWYRHSVAEAERVLELEKQVPPTVNPASRRVMRGNLYSTIANASQAAAKILLDQARKDKRSLYDFSRDEGLQFLGHFLDVHKAGTAASVENPEWEQIGMANLACRGNIEQFLRETKEHWALIYLQFQGNSTLEKLMRNIDPELYAMASSGVDERPLLDLPRPGEPAASDGGKPRPDVVLVTVNEHETKAIHDAFLEATEAEGVPVSLEGRLYHDLGTINGTTVYHAISEMGSGGSGGMQQTVEKAITALDPGAIIAVGIAFGVNEEEQQIGDIIVSKLLRLYELQRVGKRNKIVLRGARPDASPRLMSHFRGFSQTKWKGQRVRIGVMLTGEKLIDNVDYRKQLVKFESEAEGGEMEGAGLYVSSFDNKVDWIVIKAICDWADGNKGVDKTTRQKLAAMNAAKFLVESLKYAALKRVDPRGQPRP